MAKSSLIARLIRVTCAKRSKNQNSNAKTYKPKLLSCKMKTKLRNKRSPRLTGYIRRVLIYAISISSSCMSFSRRLIARLLNS